MFAGGGELVPDEAQPEEPAAEGVLRVVGVRAGRARRLGVEGLLADGEAQLDVGLDFARVECAVEGPELDGVGGPLGREGRVEVEQVVAAVVVVRSRTPAPVAVGAVAEGVPDLGEGFHRGGLDPVDLPQEGGLDRAAPLPAAEGGDAQGEGEEVFLGVDDVHQPPQALGSVLAQPDVYVDAAGVVGLAARRPDDPGDLLHHGDVVPAAHRADHLGVQPAAVPVDGGVGLDRPVPPVGHGHHPVVQVPPAVDGGRSEVCRESLGGPFPPDAGGFEFDAEGLVFHGAPPSGGGFSRPPGPPGGFPARRAHSSLRRAEKSR